MRHVLLRAWAALALLMAAVPVLASSPVSIVMGSSRDGSLQELQSKVDRLIGHGRLDVRTDFIGAHPGDPDPWFWVNNGSRAVAVKLIDRKSPHGVVGWYDESLGRPVIDGIGDGVVLDHWRLRGTSVIVRLPSSVTRFGFYVEYGGNDHGDDHGDDDGDDDRVQYRYFTNRLFNDIGPRGRGAEHSPFDGDVQMLIYDVSRWLGADTWLVACEYSDSGNRVGHEHGDSDNDFSDILYTVTGLGATPTLSKTFSEVKALYR